MQRSSAVLLVAGATGIFVTLGVLVRAVHSESSETNHPPATASTASIENDRSAPPGAAPSLPGILAPKRSLHAPGITIDRASDRGDTTDSPTPSIADDHAPPATRGNTKNLEFGGTQLRAQAGAARPAIQKCVADAAAKGIASSGTATLTYVVVKKGDKVEVQDTGIDDDKTTLQGGELLDCMRETARQMKFVGLPREANGLVVTRSVTVDSGKLVEYKHVGFSYL